MLSLDETLLRMGRAESRGQPPKHDVSFGEAASVFSDPLARTHDDLDHSGEERREYIVGHSVRHLLLVVCFTQRELAIRIFSAREVTRTERQDYEENADP